MADAAVAGTGSTAPWAEVHRRLRSHPLVMDHVLVEGDAGTYGRVVLRSEHPVFPEELDAILRSVHRGLPARCRLAHLEIVGRTGRPDHPSFHSSDQRTE